MPGNLTRYANKAFQNFVKLGELTATTNAADPDIGTSQFFSEIINRAPIIDLTNDLNSRVAINRIDVSSIEKISNEIGPADEQVFGVLNDRNGQIRYVGDWNFDDIATNAHGPAISTPDSGTGNDFVEVTFFGTGLNMLVLITSDIRDLRVTVDGGAEEAPNLFPTSGSSVLNGRQYNPNAPLPIKSGLSFGLHTIKIRSASTSFGIIHFGFEILNEQSTINVRPGTALIDGKETVLSAAQNLAFDSTFENESGSDTGRGGHVRVYLDKDGNLKKRCSMD